MTTLAWKYNGLIINQPVDIGSLTQEEESLEYEIELLHDSDLSITDLGFYISPFTGDYSGTHSPTKDYERVLWLSNNYPGFGLSIRQEYLVTGVIDRGSNLRYFDLERFEPNDIFKGETLLMTSGEEANKSAIIESYDVDRKLFFLSNDFASDIVGSSYQVSINRETFFKNKQGSSYVHPIGMIKNGGFLRRLETVRVFLKIRIPKFALSGGSFLFDINTRFNSLEEGLE